MHVITQDGVLWRTLPCPIPPGQRHRLQGVRLAGPDPLPQSRLSIQRKVSSRGGIQVARQRIQVGFRHAGQTVTIELGDTTLRVIGQHGELVTTIPRTGNGEITRFKAYGTGSQDDQVPAPLGFPPNTLATITARSRLPVASSRTCMADSGKDGSRPAKYQKLMPIPAWGPASYRRCYTIRRSGPSSRRSGRHGGSSQFQEGHGFYA